MKKTNVVVLPTVKVIVNELFTERREDEVTSNVASPKDAAAKLLNVPSHSSVKQAMDTLAADKDSLKDSLNAMEKTHGATTRIMRNGKAVRVVHETKNGIAVVEFSDIDALTQGNKIAKKIFVYVLHLANKLCVYKGELIKDSFTFSPKNLVEAGMYSAPQSALRGIRAVKDLLTSMKLNAIHDEKTKKGLQNALDATVVLFPAIVIKHGEVLVQLNPLVDWGAFTAQFMKIPTFFFELDNREADLLYNLYFMLRMRGDEMRRSSTGSFVVTLKSVKKILQLPDVKGCKQPKRDIISPIVNAVAVINAKHLKSFGTTLLELDANPDMSADDFLKGNLVVTPTDDVRKEVLTLDQKKRNRIETAKKKSEAKKKRDGETLVEVCVNL